MPLGFLSSGAGASLPRSGGADKFDQLLIARGHTFADEYVALPGAGRWRTVGFPPRQLEGRRTLLATRGWLMMPLSPLVVSTVIAGAIAFAFVLIW